MTCALAAGLTWLIVLQLMLMEAALYWQNRYTMAALNGAPIAIQRRYQARARRIRRWAPLALVIPPIRRRLYGDINR
jgi:hypothetical protein